MRTCKRGLPCIGMSSRFTVNMPIERIYFDKLCLRQLLCCMDKSLIPIQVRRQWGSNYEYTFSISTHGRSRHAAIAIILSCFNTRCPPSGRHQFVDTVAMKKSLHIIAFKTTKCAELNGCNFYKVINLTVITTELQRRYWSSKLSPWWSSRSQGW